ncbi:MAG: Crp/Fnr family transcriptional regulator [Rhodospirillaceae bacterium]
MTGTTPPPLDPQPLTAADAVRLRSAGFLAPFGRETMAALFAESRVVVAAPFQTLFDQDEPAEVLWVVIEGTVGLMAAVGPTGSCLIELAGPAQVIGEAGLFDTGRHPTAARAITAARLAQIPAASILACLEAQPPLRRHMLGFLSARLHALVRQIALLKLMGTAQRLATFLLGLTERRAGPQTVHLACERRIIAGMLGMTPESLSRALAQLRALGVHSEGKRDIVVSSPERLRAFLAEA